jgi:hypothetical protein
VKLGEEIRGREHDARDPVGGRGDLLGPQDADRAFDEEHHRQVRSARGVEGLQGLLHVGAGFDVGKQQGVGAGPGHRLDVLGPPRRVEVVHADHDFAPPVASGEYRLHDEAARLDLHLDEDRIPRSRITESTRSVRALLR